MNDNQNKHYNAADGMLAVMDSKTGLWTGKPKVVEYRTAIEDDLAAIDALEVIQTADKTGVTESKELYKFEKGLQVFTVAQLVAAYAFDEGDTDTRKQVLMPKSKFQHGSEATLHARWKTIFDVASLKVDDMIDKHYDITTTQVSDINTYITTLHSKSGQVTAAGSQKVAATKTLGEAFDDLAENQKLLFENCANIFLTDPQFQEAMENAVKTDNSGVRHQALRIIVEDSVIPEVRLRNVNVTIQELKLSLVTSKRGVVTFKSADVAAGNYSILVELPGYVSQILNNVAVLDTGVKFVLVRLVKENGRA